MFNITKITKVTNNIKAYFKRVGVKDVIKSTFISPYGLYSKPKDKQGLSIFRDKWIMALHSHKNIPITLNDNDIILTDGKSYIHIEFNGKAINIKTKELNINASKVNISCDTFSVNANSITFKSASFTHNGRNVGATHY
jgi:hypothetical protein